MVKPVYISEIILDKSNTLSPNPTVVRRELRKLPARAAANNRNRPRYVQSQTQKSSGANLDSSSDTETEYDLSAVELSDDDSETTALDTADLLQDQQNRTRTKKTTASGSENSTMANKKVYTKAQYDLVVGKWEECKAKLAKYKEQAQGLMKNDRTKDKLIAELTEKINTLTQKFSGSKANQQDDVILELEPIARKIIFRNVKFVEDPADLLDVTKKAMKEMSVNPGISENDFAATYNNVVKKALSYQRNYVQLGAKKRAMGKIFCCWWRTYFASWPEYFGH